MDECRHVWSIGDPMVDMGEMTIAFCLRCGEKRSLVSLIQEGLDSMEADRGRTNEEVEAEWAARRARMVDELKGR